VIVAAVNAHQRTDKGFGPALGPIAGAEAIARFAAVGYVTVHETSDWTMGPQDREMRRVEPRRHAPHNGDEQPPEAE